MTGRVIALPIAQRSREVALRRSHSTARGIAYGGIAVAAKLPADGPEVILVAADEVSLRAAWSRLLHAHALDCSKALPVRVFHAGNSEDTP
jgi:hypothetical protein